MVDGDCKIKAHGADQGSRKVGAAPALGQERGEQAVELAAGAGQWAHTCLQVGAYAPTCTWMHMCPHSPSSQALGTHLGTSGSHAAHLPGRAALPRGRVHLLELARRWGAKPTDQLLVCHSQQRWHWRFPCASGESCVTDTRSWGGRDLGQPREKSWEPVSVHCLGVCSPLACYCFKKSPGGV